MKTITIEVSDELASRLLAMSGEERENLLEKAESMLENSDSLSGIMDKMSAEAQKNGMTPEMLERIIKEIDEEE